MKTILLFLIMLFALGQIQAQQILSDIKGKAKDNFHVNGSLAGNSTLYYVKGIDSRRDPLNWAINGNLNIQIGQLALPFTVTFNQQETRFTRPQPFNQFGVSPKYKWVTAHLGYRTLQFSELTLAGNMFLGAGIELVPEDFPMEFRAVYGRFSRAIRPDNINFYNAQPAYERWGYGSKITFKKNESTVDLIFFKAKDDINSLDTSISNPIGLTPAENFVSGLNFKSRLSKRFSVEVQSAISAYTKDIRTREVTLDSYTYLNNLGGLYIPRASTQVNGAVISKIGYSANAFQADLSYRRIGPDFRTMGSSFLNNDLRDITLNAAKPFFQNKLQLSGGGGVQKNNLDNSKQSRMVRLIGNANCTYAPNQHLSFNINYANFSTRTTQSVFVANTKDQIDSLFYLQVTNNAGFSVAFNPGKKEKPSRNNFMLNTNYQKAKDMSSGSSEFYSINLSDQITFTEKKLNINAGFNMSNNTATAFNQLMAGPAISMVKSFGEVKSVLSSTWQHTFADQNNNSKLFNARMNFTYTYKKKHVFGIDMAYLTRYASGMGTPDFHEWRGGFNYRYIFEIL